MGGGTFKHAVAIGLPVLGGEDVFATSGGLTVRGHFWKSDGDGLPVLICPGFTEFCEKFSPAAAHLHAKGHSVLIIDWPGQGRSAIWPPAIMASISTGSNSISPRWTR